MTALSQRRAQERADFLASAGWRDASATPLAGDASTRSYERLARGVSRAVLMNAPPAAESASCPPDADDQTRRTLGYNALARLAGPNLHAFIEISATLRKAGLSAPDIYAADARAGFALIEDLGDDLYARAIPAGADERRLYETAVDALLVWRAQQPTPPAAPGYRMLTYDRLAMEAEIGLLTEWYWPHRRGAPAPASAQAEYFAAWSVALDQLAPPSQIVLRDFHAENLLWLPDRAGARRTGLIDFQDALVGHPAYDLASLLEDARRDVSAEITEAMIARFIVGAHASGDFDEDAFRRDFAIIAAQRNAKILGIFARLVRRDGKPKYESLLPRVEAHFRRDLAHPALARVRSFMARALPELAP